MTPVVMKSESLNLMPNIGQTKTQRLEAALSVVDLALSTRRRELLHLFDLLTAVPSIRGEHPDVQLQRLLQLVWLITIRAFTASTTFYIGERFHDGRSFVGPTDDDITEPIVPIHVDTHESVLDLFGQMVNGLVVEGARLYTNGQSTKVHRDCPLNTTNTTIVYQRHPVNVKNGTRACADRCQVCCPIPLTESVEPGFALKGLQLYIRCAPDDHLVAQLDVGATGVDLPLAASILHSFNQALTSIGSAPTQPIGNVDMCSGHHREWIASLTRPLAPPRDELLHALCLRHVRSTPDAPAVRSWDGDLTYYELNDLTSRLAHWLVGRGVRPGVFVACAFYKSTWAIVARLAVLMAGGAYICMDAHDPPPYLASVLQRTHTQVMLASVGFGEKFADQVNARFEVSEASLRALPSFATTPCSTVQTTDPCVVLFTSGSTGNPKGIIQEHRSYASALTDYIRVTGMGPHSRLFQFDAYAFDISNNDLLAPLIAGGCCCVPTTSLTIEALMVDLNDLQANMMFVTPSVAVDIDPDKVPTLQVMCIGGEPVSDAVLAKWLDRVQVVNQYGMGEVASLCAYNLNLQMGRGAVVGRPASGAIWIVNPDSPNQLMPVGAVGELLIEGPHISRGYLDHVSGKSENFLPAPPVWMAQLHADRPLHRLYRSGDLGRYNHDGTIELVGRKDTMLKLDGARVEAGQVEYVLRRQLSTGDAVVVDVLGTVDGISDPILAAYLYMASNPTNMKCGPVEDMQFRPIEEHHAIYSLTKALREAVRQNLPPYYVPSLFLLIDRVPRTRSMKTDRRKLHMLGQAYYMAHREELREITVWPEWD
ncbi:AMP-dependent synthetase/ligase [Penicillium hispanicum]|uniref:AMP-dependent synthetase/ligase n=1 Tax=Penicillium hispanicum TaxID=1080232 RepID=UPI0025413D78|nr:AMP-dependent synthetase/ligase [Penicillium hispanicum]KAJ5584764.1 AMP-dependent synthetase/ligase [Penicillium hispanicum]